MLNTRQEKEIIAAEIRSTVTLLKTLVKQAEEKGLTVAIHDLSSIALSSNNAFQSEITEIISY